MRAAEVVAEHGARVVLFEGKPSVGRKLLVAGRGGLNLTHSEPVERFAGRYLGGAGAERWRALLAEFGPAELRAWAAKLGVQTFVGTSGRMFPVEKQAAGLLRRWLARLRGFGVSVCSTYLWESLRPAHDTSHKARWRLRFQNGVVAEAKAVVFALGGASWPETGSNGAWVGAFQNALGVRVVPWQPANCGWEIAAPGWSEKLLAEAEGKPLKNIIVRVVGDDASTAVAGELLITRYGLEGGTLYALGPALRARPPTARRLEIDLKPQLSAATLATRLPAPVPSLLTLDAVTHHWRLAPVARLLLEYHGPGGGVAGREVWLRAVKNFSLPLAGPRPIAEAISSAGGVAWEEVDDALMLRRLPGVFLCGEMLDWEAPTGGYLLQGCFATGTRAGRGAATWKG